MVVLSKLVFNGLYYHILYWIQAHFMFFIYFVCHVSQDMIRNRYVDTKYVIVSNFKTDVCWGFFWGIDTKHGIIVGPPNRKEMSRRDIGQRKTSIYVCQAINNLVENHLVTCTTLFYRLKTCCTNNLAERLLCGL